MNYFKKIRIGIYILLGMAFCCAWTYVKADTFQRESKMIMKIFKKEK
jgi:hypothetical protein